MIPRNEPACPTTCGACLPGGMCCHAGATDLIAWVHLPEVLVRALLGFLVSDASFPPGAEPRSRVARLAIGAIREYQLRISSRRAPCCRFVPSCSAYAASAIERFRTDWVRCGDRWPVLPAPGPFRASVATIPGASPSGPALDEELPAPRGADAGWCVEKPTRSESAAVASKQALPSAPKGGGPVRSAEVAGKTADGFSPAPHASQSVQLGLTVSGGCRILWTGKSRPSGPRTPSRRAK